MLSNLKIGVAKRRMAAAIKRTFPRSESQLQRIGLILDSENEEVKGQFLALKEEFGLRDSHFQIVMCKDGEKKGDAFNGVVFTRKDLNWYGKIRNGEIAQFVQQELDVLISFTEENNKLAALLVSVANAGLKVGRKEDLGSAGLFDMVIATGFNEPGIFIAELKKYLKILNKIE